MVVLSMRNRQVVVIWYRYQVGIMLTYADRGVNNISESGEHHTLA
jgi:hypothetical protein